MSKRAHPHLVTVLTTIVPWATLAAAAAFFIAWVTSLITKDPDEAALAMTGVMLGAAAYAWLTRMALLSLAQPTQAADPETEP